MLTSAASSLEKRGRRAATARRQAAGDGSSARAVYCRAMPHEPSRRRPEVELLELRVLDGPNRFFTRPAVKLEFGSQTPGLRGRRGRRRRRWPCGGCTSRSTCPAPRLAVRHSVDRRRAAIAFPWRRRTIAQAIGAAAARIALGTGAERRELRSPARRGARAAADLPRAADADRGGHRDQRQEHHHPADSAHRRGGRAADRDDQLGRHLSARRAGRGGGLDRLRGCRTGACRAQPGLGGARDGTWRDPAARDRLCGQRRSGGHQRQRRSPGAAGDRHARRAGRGEGHRGAHHAADRLGGAQRGRSPGVGACAARRRARWYPFSLDPEHPAVEEALDRARPRGDPPAGLAGAAGRRPAPACAWRAPSSCRSPSPACRATTSRTPWRRPRRPTRWACRREQIAAGLRSFAQDNAVNPGRLNLYRASRACWPSSTSRTTRPGCPGCWRCAAPLANARPGRRRGPCDWPSGTAGDRTDEILHSLGRAGRPRSRRPRHLREAPLPARARPGGDERDPARAAIREGGYAGEVRGLPDRARGAADAARARRGAATWWR